MMALITPQTAARYIRKALDDAIKRTLELGVIFNGDRKGA